MTMEIRMCEKCGFEIMTVKDGRSKWIDDSAGVSEYSDLELCGECLKEEKDYLAKGGAI